MSTLRRAPLAALLSITPALVAAQVAPPAGYIYDTQLLGSPTQGCVAAGPGGTFVGIGTGFTANAQAVVLARESGDLRLVAFGFNSIGDCAYDRTRDVLYVSDNADNADLDLTTGVAGNTGAQSGDTVFAVPSASTASGLRAAEIELVPADSIAFASSLAIDANGDVFVSDAAGAGLGEVVRIDTAGTPSLTTFASPFDFTGGLAFGPATGRLFVAETLASFESQITAFDTSGTPVPPVPFSGPGFTFGSFDLAFDAGGTLLVTGLFFGDVVALDAGGTPSPFISGLTFATGITVHPFTQRIEVLSSTFTGADEDRSLHRFTPVDRLTPGSGSASSECVHEFYGVELAGPAANTAACVDGTACDADGRVDDRCLFPVGFCLLVDDPDLPDCSPPAAALDVQVATKPFDAAVARAADAIAAALPVGGSSCFFSDGYTVPVKRTKAGAKEDGKGKVTVRSEVADGRTDKDTVKLVCQPSP